MAAINIVRMTSFLLALAILAGCTSPNVADHVFVNGPIYTANSGRETVSAMAIRNDIVIATGTADDMERYLGPNTKRIDLDGRMILPGLHDTHLHPISAMPIKTCDLENKPMPLSQITSHLKNCVVEFNLDKSEWITAIGWNFAAGNQPNSDYRNLRQALDAVHPSKPAFLFGSDGHHYAGNSAALARAKNKGEQSIGFSARTLKEEFADLKPYIGVDEMGEPNGRLNEDYPLLSVGIGNFLELGMEERRAHPELLMDVTLPHGITSFLDAAADPNTLDIYDKLIADNALQARVTLALFLDPESYQTPQKTTDFAAMMRDAGALKRKYAAAPNIKANFLKLFVDGVLEGDPLSSPPLQPNAALSRNYLQPIFAFDEEKGVVRVTGYADLDSEACVKIRAAKSVGTTTAVHQFRDINGYDPAQCTTSSGVLQHDAEFIKNYVRAGDAAGFTLFMHAIGDRAVQSALDAIEISRSVNNSKARHIITHLQLVRPADIKRFKDLGVFSSFTFAWAYTDLEYDLTVIPFIDRVDPMNGLYDPKGYYFTNAYPAASIRDAGGIVIAGSDAPVDTADPRPFVNIEGAVNRTLDGGQLNGAQTITIFDAIDAYTSLAAKALQQETLTGSLEKGKKADFIIIDQNIIALTQNGESAKISDTKVLETWFNGKLVYKNPEIDRP